MKVNGKTKKECVCVCVRERERERRKSAGRKGVREKDKWQKRERKIWKCV